MQMQTDVRSRPRAEDEELIDVLIAISVVAKRLAENLRAKERKKEDEPCGEDE